MNDSLNATVTMFNLSNVEIGILSFLNVIFSILGSCGNVFVCFVFVAFSRLRYTMNVFILSLALSDLLVCMLAQPMFVTSLLKHYQQKQMDNTFEAVRKCLTWISLLASVGNLLGVTIDRYVAITNPLRYGNNDGIKPSACVFVGAVWVVAICFGTGTVFNTNMKIVGQIYVFVIVICFILPLYSRVWYIARQHRQCILAQRIYNTVNTDSTAETPRRRRTEEHLYAAVKTVGLISALFVLGWFPLLVVPFIYRSKVTQRQLVLSLFQWVNTLALCSSTTNPIVYSWTDRKFRKSLWLIYNRWTTKRRIELEQS